MTVFSGKGVYGAIAIGKLSIFKKNDTTIKRMHVEDTEAEKARRLPVNSCSQSMKRH